LAVINFNHQNLKRASADCLDLLKRMLKADPKQRISAGQALKHPFLASKEDSDSSLVLGDEGISDKLRDFQHQ
jgi:serine/threonine protein kinase